MTRLYEMNYVLCSRDLGVQRRFLKECLGCELAKQRHTVRVGMTTEGKKSVPSKTSGLGRAGCTAVWPEYMMWDLGSWLDPGSAIK